MENRIFYRKDEKDNLIYIELKRRVDKLLSELPGDRINMVRVRAVVFPFIYFSIYTVAVFFYSNPLLYFLLYGCMGLVILFIFLNLIHDSVHETIFKKKWMNKAMLYIFDLLGANSFIWKKRHIVCHHRFQNISGWDSDIEQSGIFKVFPHAPSKKFHTIQHKFIFLLYPFYLINWLFIRDFKDFFNKNQVVRKMIRIPFFEYIKLFFFKALWIFHIIFIPYLLGVPLGVAIAATLFMLVVAGVFALSVLLTAHVNTQCEFPVADESGTLPNSWLKHQFETTNDVSVNNWFTRNVMGNFNYHLAHHLFPRMCYTYAPEITGVIKDFAREFNFNYRSLSLKDSLALHYRLIKQNGVSTEVLEEDM
jgi:linoleoyl-CoA desaturase